MTDVKQRFKSKNGEKAYHPICMTCNITFSTSDKRRKFCSQNCAKKDFWKRYPRKGFITKGGYRKITINGKIRSEHRIIWEIYNGQIPNGFLIHHINENKLDNRIENLRLMKWGEHTKQHWKKGGMFFNRWIGQWQRGDSNCCSE